MRRLLLISVFLVLGCETKEDNQIAKGQACLDSADRTTAAGCEDAIDGLDSPAAFAIRCSSQFIAEGFDTLTMAKAFTNLEDSGGGTSSMLGILVFSTKDKAIAAANVCAKSGVASMALLGSLAKTATLITSVCNDSGSSFCTFDPTADRESGFPEQGLLDALAYLTDPTNDAATEEVKTAIGSAVLVAYDQQCSIEANKTTDIYKDIVAAMSTTRDPLAIGKALIARLASM